MNKTVDARGLSCPMPVVAAKKALEGIEEGKIEVLVDNEVARDNVTKFAVSSGYAAQSESRQAGYAVQITKKMDIAGTAVEGILGQNNNKPIVLLIKDHLFGVGDEELGRILMRSFLFTLTESDEPIKTIAFMNSGVYLALDDSEVLPTLKKLEDAGVEILSCGTCLDFYGCKDRLAIGSVTNMYTAVDHLLNQGNKTITI